MLSYAATAWVTQVEELGFQAPVEDPDGYVDLYIFDYSGGGAYAYCSSWGDDDPNDDLTGCPAYLALDRGITDDEMAIYVAHEFNHVLQYATDYNEPTYPVWEGVASAAEIWTYPKDRAGTIEYSFPVSYTHLRAHET